jgi:hypothetical protein
MGEIMRRVPTTEERLRGVHPSLVGATLCWKRYRAWNAAWLPGRCELCHAPFSEDGVRGTLHSGYSVMGGGPAGQDDYVWICATCLERGAWFGWLVVEMAPNGRDQRGPGDLHGRA